MNNQVNNPFSRCVSTQKRDIPFVRADAKGKEMLSRWEMGILTETRDWVLLADVNRQLKFSSDMAIQD